MDSRYKRYTLFLIWLMLAPVCPSGDTDGDGIVDLDDICPTIFNPDQDVLACAPLSGTYDVVAAATTAFIGEWNQDLAGSALAGAGDVNGDGFPDMLIGAHYNDEGGDMAGKIYLYLGKTEGFDNEVELLTAEISFIGEALFDCAGYSVSSAGDVNGDGLSDFLISGFMNDEAGIDAGKIYLLFGKRSGWTTGFPLSLADAAFLGEKAGDGAGFRVSGGGDVNGDGLSDFVMTTPANQDGGALAGKVYLFLGKRELWPASISLSEADASWIGEPNDQAGFSVDISGDLDGDGFSDLVIGTPGNSESGVGAGKVYLIFGKQVGWAKNVALQSVEQALTGQNDFDHAGSTVAFAGDINGDHFNDLLIGSPGDDTNGSDAGSVALILGRADRNVLPPSLAYADAHFYGEVAFDQVGKIASAGDVNQDGRSDFLVGSPANDAHGTYSGKAYLLYGEMFSGAYTLSSASAMFIGEYLGDEVGFAVSGVGDFNQDSFDDFLLGALGNDQGGNMAGKAYFFYGRSSE